MPVYPFLALAIGANLSYIWQEDKFKTRFLTGFFAFLVIVGLAGCIYFSIFDKQPLLIVMSVVLAMTMGMTSWLVNQHNRQFIPVLFTGMYLVLGMLMSSQSWIWELNEKFPVLPVAALIRDNVPPGTQIYTSFPDSRPSLDFYSDCKIIPISMADLKDKFADKSYLLLGKETLPKINLNQSKVMGEANGFKLVDTN
jgi:4-amino-4-deoxy-L-arabinose transferase-like glycosyltransferase